MEVPEIIFSPEKKKPLKIGSKEYSSAFDFSLAEREIEKARKELSETEEKKNRELQELRDLLANDKSVNYRTDTPHLLRFLRVRKFDTAKAYQNIKEVYIFKEKHPELCRISANLDKLLNRNILVNLPYLNEEGNLLFYFDVGKWKKEETSFEELIETLRPIFEVMTMNPRVQVNGVIFIWEMKGLSIYHIFSFVRHWGIRGMTFTIQGLFPWRLKKILILNAGPLTRLLLGMLQPLLSNKIFQRILVLGNDKELYQHIKPVLLPKELGGFLEDSQCSVTENIIDNIPYLKYEASFTPTEKL